MNQESLRMNQDLPDTFGKGLDEFLSEPHQLFAFMLPLSECPFVPPVEPTQQPMVQIAKKRKRFSYSSKKLLADKQLYY